MTTQRRKKISGDAIGWCVFFAILIAAATFILLQIFAPKKTGSKEEKTVETSETKEKRSSGASENTQSENTQSENTGSGTIDEDPADDPKKVKQYEGDDPNTLSDLTVTINYAEVSNDFLYISAGITQFTSGRCYLTLTNSEDSSSVTRDVPLNQNASNSACQSFNIPLSGMNKGSWKISVTVKSADGKKQGSAEKTIRI